MMSEVGATRPKNHVQMAGCHGVVAAAVTGDGARPGPAGLSGDPAEPGKNPLPDRGRPALLKSPVGWTGADLIAINRSPRSPTLGHRELAYVSA